MKLPSILALFSFIFAFAASTALGAAPVVRTLTPADETFVKLALTNGQFDVHVSELALKKAFSPGVKALAVLVVDEHTTINNELETLAKAKGVDLNAPEDPAAGEAVTALEKVNGKAFDIAFLKQLYGSYSKELAAYQPVLKTTRDDDLKKWLPKTLPKLQDHLTRIAKLLAPQASPR